MTNQSTAPKTPAQAMTVAQTKPSAAQVANVARRAKALEILGDTLKIDPPMLMQILKNQIMPGASDDEIAAIVIVSNVYDLNPLLREIYAFPDPKRKRIVPVVGVDGWAKIINRQPDYDGCEFVMETTPEGKPVSCTCKLYSKSRSHAMEITEYFDECKRGTDPWNNMPKRMLRHKAFIQAGRVAFGISGIYDEDEARDIVVTDAQVTTSPLIAAPPFITQPEQPPANVAPLPENEPEPPKPERITGQPGPGYQAAMDQAAQPDATEGLDTDGVLSLIQQLMKKDGVSEDQVIGHLRNTKLATQKHTEIKHLSDSKLRTLANAWTRELDAIKTIQV